MTNSVDLMKVREDGLKAAMGTLQEERDMLLKAQTLDEQAESAAKESRKLEKEVEELESKISQMVLAKKRVLESSLGVLRERMQHILNSEKGYPVFNLVEEKLVYGWMMKVDEQEIFVPYAGLSGGQRVEFDSAFAYALLSGSKNGIVVLEAAELGNELPAMLDHIASSTVDAQIFVNSCFEVDEDSIEGWQVFSQKEVRGEA
jgi:hypothetical protein